MYKLFGISSCDTVKKARTFLEKKGVKLEFIDFKKIPPTTENIERWSELFGGLPVNTKGTTYKKFKDTYEALSDKAKLTFLCENPSMIKRPILERNGKVLHLGFDEERYKKFIS